MKAKSKPAKGSARTRKFASGGDIAALAGLGTLAYLLSRKKDEGKATTSDIKPLKEASVQDTDERFKGSFKGDVADVMPAEPEKSKMYTATPGEGVATPQQAPVRGSIGKRVLASAKTRASDKVGAGYERLAGVGAGYEGIDPRSKEEKTPSTPNADRPSKPYPANAKGTEKDPYLRGSGPKNTFLTKDRSDQANKAVGQAWRDQNPTLAKMLGGMKKGGKVKKYAEGGAVTPAPTTPPPPPKKKEPTGMELEVENAKKDARVRREGAGAEKEVKRNMSTFGLKKGGKVKSASARADGCCVRGKTRA